MKERVSKNKDLKIKTAEGSLPFWLNKIGCLMDKKMFSERKATRLKDFNYNTQGAYFITICTKDKCKILSSIIDGVGDDVLDVPNNEYGYENIVKLTPVGKVAEKYINQLNNFYSNISVDSYVIMPNHVHILLSVINNGVENNCNSKQNNIVSQFVSTLKRFINKEYGKNVWQRSFFDHVIRNEADYQEHLRYICENPLKWHLDSLYKE